MTYTQEVAQAYSLINEGLKLIHLTLQEMYKQQAIINKANRELMDKIITPENIIGGEK